MQWVARKRLTKAGYFVCEEGSKAVGKRDKSWKVSVKRIYGVRVYLRFARGAWDCRYYHIIIFNKTGYFINRSLTEIRFFNFTGLHIA